MRRKMFGKSIRAVMLAASVMLALAGVAGQSGTQSAPAGGAVVCRVLEARTVDRMNVTLVLFHQAQKGEAERLSELLHQHDGASVEFETSDARPHTATVLRLGTCFGRGLLVFSSNEVQLSKQDQFWLRFPH